MKFPLRVNPLLGGLPAIIRLLGDTWLDESIDAIILGKSNTAHPVIGAYLRQYWFEDVFLRAHLPVPRSSAAWFLDVAGKNIGMMMSWETPESIKGRLMDARQAPGLLFEAYVSAALVRSGGNVIRRPHGADYELRTGDGRAVFVECKAAVMTAAEAKDGVAGHELSSILHGVVSDRGFGVRVDASMDEVPEEPTSVDAVLNIMRRWDPRTTSETFAKVPGVRVHVRRLTTRGHAISASDPLLASPDRETVASTMFIGDALWEAGEWRLMAPAITYVHAPSRLRERVARTTEAFRAAASQIPSTGPGVVFVELSGGAPVDANEEAREVAAAIRRMLGGAHSRVNVVVLTWIRMFRWTAVDFGPLAGREGLEVQSWCIHHSRPRTPIPEGIVIPGCVEYGGRTFSEDFLASLKESGLTAEPICPTSPR